MTITHDDDGSGKVLLVGIARTVDVLRPGQSITIDVPTGGELTVSVQLGIPAGDPS